MNFVLGEKYIALPSWIDDIHDQKQFVGLRGVYIKDVGVYSGEIDV